MSSLFKNQFYRELQQNRELLASWCGLLLLELVKGLSQTTQFFESDGSLRPGGGDISWVNMAMVAIACFLPLSLGVGDSPSNDRGFIQTRPVSMRIVWAAKALVLVLFVFLLAGAVPFAICLVHGAGLAHALHAVVDRLAFLIPVSVFFLCWSGLASSPGQLRRFTVAGTVIIGGTLFLTIGTLAVIDTQLLDLVFEEPGSLPARLIMVFSIAALVSAWGLMMEMRRRRKPRRAIGVAVLIALAVGVIFSIPGLNPLRADTGISAEIAAAMDAVEVRVDPYSFNGWETTERSEGEGHVHLQARFKVEGTPAGMVTDPRIRGATLSGSDGFRTESRSPRRDNFRPVQGNLSKEVLRAIAESFGRDLSFHFASHGMDYGASRPRTEWESEHLAGRLEEPLDLEYALDLGVVGVRSIARMPLGDAGGAKGIKNGNGGGISLFRAPQAERLAIRARLPRAWLTRDPALRVGRTWNLRDRFICLLVHPERTESLVCDPVGSRISRGVLSGYPELVLFYQYIRSQPRLSKFDETFIEGAEVHLFELTRLGSHAATARFDGLRLRRRMADVTDSSDRRLDDIAARSALARLGEVPAEPDERYLDALLQIVDNIENYHWGLGYPGWKHLLQVGQRNLGLLIAAQNSRPFRSRNALLRTIDHLAGEQDKQKIIASLSVEPEMALLVVNRGWEADAADEILDLLGERRKLPHAALQAAVLLNDPATHPFLLEQFAANLDAGSYDLLWGIPELRPELDRMVQERWTPFLMVPNDGRKVEGAELRLALRTGNVEALDFALEALQGDHEYSAHNALRPVLLIPRNTLKAKNALVGVSGSQFEFETARRVFRRRTEDRKEVHR